MLLSACGGDSTAAAQQFASLHTLSDQHKKWVSGVGVGVEGVIGGGRGRGFVREIVFAVQRSMANVLQ